MKNKSSVSFEDEFWFKRMNMYVCGLMHKWIDISDAVNVKEFKLNWMRKYTRIPTRVWFFFTPVKHLSKVIADYVYVRVRVCTLAFIFTIHLNHCTQYPNEHCLRQIIKCYFYWCFSNVINCSAIANGWWIYF